jgi:hypothetical protein
VTNRPTILYKAWQHTGCKVLYFRDKFFIDKIREQAAMAPPKHSKGNWPTHKKKKGVDDNKTDKENLAMLCSVPSGDNIYRCYYQYLLVRNGAEPKQNLLPALVVVNFPRQTPILFPSGAGAGRNRIISST